MGKFILDHKQAYNLNGVSKMWVYFPVIPHDIVQCILREINTLWQKHRNPFIIKQTRQVLDQNLFALKHTHKKKQCYVTNREFN